MIREDRKRAEMKGKVKGLLEKYCGVNGILKRFTAVLVIGVFVVMPMLVSGCTRKIYVPVDQYVAIRDTLKVVRELTDTVMISDSIVIHQGGDTVVIERFRTDRRFHNRCDTVWRMRCDTIFKEVPVYMKADRTEKCLPNRLWLMVAVGFGVAVSLGIAVFAIRRMWRCRR